MSMHALLLFSPLLCNGLFFHFIFSSTNNFYFPTLLVGGFALSDLLDKPWSQVPSLLPPRHVKQTNQKKKRKKQNVTRSISSVCPAPCYGLLVRLLFLSRSASCVDLPWFSLPWVCLLESGCLCVVQPAPGNIS